jgi:putative DNA methylase
VDGIKFELKPVREKPSIRQDRLDSFAAEAEDESQEIQPMRFVPPEGKRFIESARFPFARISEVSAGEKGSGRPPHWEMVFWWTRKPQIGARAVIAGCLLPEDTSPENFLKALGIGEKRGPHRVTPRLRFDGVSLLDPFAGFGSIPLEAARLGLDATAVELLSVPYVFLKAVLEYPAKYDRALVMDVEKWGNWVTERLKEDPMIKELYDDDVAVYIGSWEVKCPSCGRWTPLVGNWWLARVKGKKGYDRLAWMEYEKSSEEVEIRVKDLNKEFGNLVVEGVKVEELKVSLKDDAFRVPGSNIDARREQATCLLCDQTIKFIDPQSSRHILETKSLSREEKADLIWYVKYALGRYHEGDPSLARLRLLVKVKLEGGDLEFEPCTHDDQERLKLAQHEVDKLLEQEDPDIPREGVSLYSVRYLFPILYGMKEWYQFFNPRQLLTLVKLVKLIREASKLVEQEKIKEGISQEEAFKYAEAVTTYLAITLLRYSTFTTLVSPVRADTMMGAIVAGSLTFRGVSMVWNYCDLSPFCNITGSWVRSLKNSNEGLRYLVDILPFGKKNLDIQLDDATILNNIKSGIKYNLIVTDPPYYDDVPYSELSDIYYIWFKRCLSDIENNNLKPKFLPEAFFDKIGNNWIEISTQWEKYALSEVSLNPPRLGHNANKNNGVKHFQNLLNTSFTTMFSRLKDDGLLATYYAHTDPDAWKALLEAGWEKANLKVTNAFPLTTESAQSVVSRGKLSMDTSIVVVWRKGSEGFIDASVLYEEMTEEAAEKAKDLIELGYLGRDLLIGALGSALAAATKYREVRVMGKIDVRTLVDEYVYPATLLGLTRALARRAELKDGVKSPDAMFYLLVKFTLAGAKPKVLESTDARIFSIGTSLDLNEASRTWRLLKSGEESKGAKVAKAKTMMLIEPASTERSKLEELLEIKGVGVSEPEIRCTIDALHVLEYYAVAHTRDTFKRMMEELRVKYPAQVDEALSMVKIMSRVLPDRDVEKVLCDRILDHLQMRPHGR